jgi:hypothetical protein
MIYSGYNVWKAPARCNSVADGTDVIELELWMQKIENAPRTRAQA